MPVFSKIALYPTPSPSALVEPLRNQPLPKRPSPIKTVIRGKAPASVATGRRPGLLAR